MLAFVVFHVVGTLAVLVDMSFAGGAEGFNCVLFPFNHFGLNIAFHNGDTFARVNVIGFD